MTLEFMPNGHLKKMLLPSDEPMWVKWRDSETVLKFVGCSSLSGCQPTVKAECDTLLAEAKACLDNKPRWSTRYSLWFWRLIHRLDENLVLILPEVRLATEALYIQEVFRRNISDPITREVWSERLSRAVDALNPPLAVSSSDSAQTTSSSAQTAVSLRQREQKPEAADDATRQVLRSVLHILNEHTDRGFRNYAMNGTIQLASTVLLVAIFAVGMSAFPETEILTNPPQQLPTGAALLLGAAGAIISKLTSESACLVPTGQTAGAFLYYLVVVPAIGALAAVFALAVEHSQLLFSIVDDPNKTNAPVKIVLEQGAAAFGMMVLAVLAGFFGQWVIRSTMGRLLVRLYGNAEKGVGPIGSSESLRTFTWT